MTTETQQPAVGAQVHLPVGRLAPERVQLSRAKGWKMPPNTVKVDRSTKWGNPFKVHGDGYPMTPQVAVMLFERLLSEQGCYVNGPAHGSELIRGEDIKRLSGKNLACWCKPGTPCHADVLLRLANPEPPNARLTGAQRPHRSNDE